MLFEGVSTVMNPYGMNTSRQNNREMCLPDGFAVWCRIEDLCEVCGYDPIMQFGLLREFAGIYSGRPGQDPDDYADAYPMQALACYVRKYLEEYPEAAEALTASASVAADPKPDIAA